MKIDKSELCRYEKNVIYDEGYRIVYIYDIYHEVPQRGYYAKNIEDFALKFDNYKFTNINDLLNRFLLINDKALGVAIYRVDGTCIEKLVRSNVSKVDDREVYVDELIYDYNFVEAKDGYRIVYYYKDGSYKLGMYSPTLELFMEDFAPYEPIDELCEIPAFVSIDDLLDRYLKVLPSIDGIGLYKVDGTLLDEKYK